MNLATSLETAQPGELLIRSRRDNPDRFVEVVRVTATQIEIKDGSKFMRKGGGRTPKPYSCFSWDDVKVCSSPKEAKAIVEASRREHLVWELEHIKWSELSTAQLTAALNALKQHSNGKPLPRR